MFRIPTSKRVGIGRIPLEVLGETFVHCLPVDSDPQHIQELLSSVCRLWREVAIATPALWTSLKITYDPDLRPPLPIIRTHLQRSGTRAFSFKLIAVHSDNPDPDLPTIVLAELAAARHRWCKVHIELSRVTEEILDLITIGDAPLLQSLRCNAGEFEEDLPIPLHTLFQGCPRIELLQWSSFGLQPGPLLQPLSNTQLTSLSLRIGLSILECITLLRLSPCLSSAEFYGLYPSDLSAVPCLTHSRLCNLTAMGGTSPLSLDIELSAFLTRSRPTLRELSLSAGEQDSEPALLDILALTPHLHSLSLSFPASSLTAALIHALHPPPPPDTPLCPRLQNLRLRVVSDCPDGLCSAMLRARWGAHAQANKVACLETSRIEVMGDIHECDEEDIEALCVEGMEGEFHIWG
ncbi:hypothetical protein BD779DRAFT_1673285 [Infundibulicybe gibba]|nr:hypothetical protein BD779DRAFT_1673285 [Infundibulicybe gibba]